MSRFSLCIRLLRDLDLAFIIPAELADEIPGQTAGERADLVLMCGDRTESGIDLSVFALIVADGGLA